MRNNIEGLKQRAIELWKDKKYQTKVSEGLRRAHAQKTPEERASIRRKAWDSRGRVFTIILPYLQNDKTVPEISIETGLTPSQIRNARERSRARGLLPHPTEEQTKNTRRKAHQRQRSPMKGKIHSVETIIKMTEKHRGRELTDQEKEEIKLLVMARQIFVDLKEPDLDELCGKYKKQAITRGRKKTFLEIFYAAKLCEDVNNDDGKPSISMSDVKRIYEQIDPNAFARWVQKHSFIQEYCCLTNEKRRLLAIARTIPEYYEIATFAQFFENNGVELPKAKADQEFLEIFYAARQSALQLKNKNLNEENPFIDIGNINALYEQIDPHIFDKLSREIAFIVSKTKRNLGVIYSLDTAARLERARTFYSYEEVPSSNR